MYQVKCIEKIRDKNNHIIEYKLIDNNKNVTSVKSNELKKAIRSRQLEVTNLTLTSDNRLIDKNTNTSSKPINTDIESMLNKLKSLGYIINTFDTYCKHNCYIASSMNHLKHMFIIPDDVEYIYKLSDKEVYNKKLYKYMSHIEGALKVIGGKNLISTRHMFHYCKAQSIDLESFTTSNVTNMNNMFYGCKAKYLDLSSLDTSNVKSMGWMFGFCAAQSIDLSSFDTSNVIDMIGMFGDCKAQSIDLRSFDTSNVENMTEMFASCKAQYIDLTSFNTSNVADMDGMFWECKAQINVNDPKLKYQLQCDRGVITVFKAKCIEKIRDKNNNIIEYKLINKDKNVKQVKSDELKEAIRSGQIEVVNLTLTSNNRLIDKKPDTISMYENVSAENTLNKLKSLGYTINTFNTKCKHKCYIASSPDNTKHLLIIPDNVKYIYRLSDKEICNNALYEYMSDIEGMLKVIGGKNLISTQRLFMDCRAQSIDLSSFDTSNVTDMHNMFDCCEAQSINLTSFNTSKVTDMHEMFRECKAQSLDLSSFNTSNATDMHSMFYDCRAQSIALSSFKTSNVTDMSHMFYRCKVQSLDLRSFNTSNVTDMSSMFSCCTTQSLDLTSFDTRNVQNMNAMFYHCEAYSIDLTSFDTSNVTEMGWMFTGCKVNSLDLSSFNTSEVTDVRGVFSECKAQIKVNDHRLKAKLQIDNG